ncbi:MAG: PRC-barrel domain-containing protein [Terriglobales bacterium]
MAHYGMLRDYSFTADADDIRGADLYASDGKIGGVKDAVFDHENGDIRYLVAEVKGRKVLIQASHIFRSTADEGSFETDLTKEEAARLPEFDEKALDNEREWQKHNEKHRNYWKERENRYEAEYKRNWEEDPVMHQSGSTNIIAPNVVPDNETAPAGERIITGADLTPRRIADKFSQPAEMTNISTNLSAPDTTLRPAGIASNAENEVRGGWAMRSERLQNFQRDVRRRVPELRTSCCLCPGGSRRVA